MIDKITFENYKIFKEKQELILKPITVLIGKNSSGKSAVLRLLIMLWKSLSNDMASIDYEESPLVYRSKDYDFGGEFKDLVYKKLETRPIKLTLDIEDVEGKKYLEVIMRYYEELKAGVIEKYNLKSMHDELFQFQLNTDKVKAGQKIYKSNFQDYKPEDLSVIFKGLTFSFIFNNKIYNSYDTRRFPHSIFKLNYIEPLRPPIKRLYHRVEDKNSSPYLLFENENLRERVANWFEEKMSLGKLSVEEIPHSGYFSLRLNDTINLKDTGQGIGQSLPIVTHALNYIDNTLHIVEQPELHLPPAAHGEVAELIAESVKITSNSKFLIETHSENFILRLRKLVVEGKLLPEDLAIYSVSYDEESESSSLREIKVDSMGNVDFWPEGVFSESFEEAKAIGRAQYEKKQKIKK